MKLVALFCLRAPTLTTAAFHRFRAWAKSTALPSMDPLAETSTRLANSCSRGAEGVRGHPAGFRIPKASTSKAAT